MAEAYMTDYNGSVLDSKYIGHRFGKESTGVELARRIEWEIDMALSTNNELVRAGHIHSMRGCLAYMASLTVR